MKTLSEWISYKNNGICKGAFAGPSGVWSYRLILPGGCPDESDLKLFIADLKNRKGWMQTTLDLGRETFDGFIRHWRKSVHPQEWIAFARVESPGSIRYIERRKGIRPGRPDLGSVEIWFRPSEEKKEPLIVDGSSI